MPMNQNNDDLKSLVRTIADYPKEGIAFRDISTLLMDGEAFRMTIDRLATQIDPQKFDRIAGLEARGFIIAAGLSYALGMGKIMLRKKGKLPFGNPADVIGVDYALEYGHDRIEMHRNAVKKGERVLLVDDLLATGGTALAGTALLREAGAIVDTALFVIDLPDIGGTQKLRDSGITPHVLIEFEGD